MPRVCEGTIGGPDRAAGGSCDVLFTFRPYSRRAAKPAPAAPPGVAACGIMGPILGGPVRLCPANVNSRNAYGYLVETDEIGSQFSHTQIDSAAHLPISNLS